MDCNGFNAKCLVQDNSYGLLLDENPRSKGSKGIKSRIVMWDHRNKRGGEEGGTWIIGPDELAELGQTGSHILIWL